MALPPVSDHHIMCEDPLVPMLCLSSSIDCELELSQRLADEECMHICSKDNDANGLSFWESVAARRSPNF